MIPNFEVNDWAIEEKPIYAVPDRPSYDSERKKTEKNIGPILAFVF